MLEMALAAPVSHMVDLSNPSTLASLPRVVEAELDGIAPDINSHFASLMEQLENMREAVQRPVQRRPTNPCKLDADRLGCTDANCLARHAPQLSEECARLIVSTPSAAEKPAAAAPVHFVEGPAIVKLAEEGRPAEAEAAPGSPLAAMLRAASAAQAVHAAGGHVTAGPQPPDFVIEIERMPQGTQLTSVLPGSVPRPVLPGSLPPQMHDMLGIFTSSLPPEIVRFLTSGAMPGGSSSGPMQMISIEDESYGDYADYEDYEDYEEAEEAAHPCSAEIAQCSRLVRSSERAPIQACLVNNFEQLSPRCRCFVHHLAGAEVETAQASVRPAAAPAVRPVRPPPHMLGQDGHGQYHGQPPAPHMLGQDGHGQYHESPALVGAYNSHVFHRLGLFFVLTTMAMFSFLLLRSLLRTLCAPRAPSVAVVVKPHVPTKGAFEQSQLTPLTTADVLAAVAASRMPEATVDGEPTPPKYRI